jgi:hypothetical protein
VARNNTIKFLRTTAANLTSQAGSNGLIEGEPYLITDSGQIAVGLSASTYRRCAMTVQSSFTPSIIGTSSAGTGTYSTQSGIYVRNGNLVHAQMRLAWSAHSGTGNMRVDFSGIPYSPHSNALPAIPLLWVSGITLTNAHIQGNTNGSQIVLQTVASGGTPALIAMQSSGEIRLVLQYYTDDAF